MEMAQGDKIEGQFERITKLAAAERQLRTAIKMLFAEDDSVSIPTLVAAAHGVLGPIAKAKGYPGGLRVMDWDLIPIKLRKQVHKILTAPERFFKHADRDSHATLVFNPQVTAYLMFDCVMMCIKVTRCRFVEIPVFAAWFSEQYPDFLRSGRIFEAARKIFSDRNLALTKAQCLDVIENPDQWP